MLLLSDVCSARLKHNVSYDKRVHVKEFNQFLN